MELETHNTFMQLYVEQVEENAKLKDKVKMLQNRIKTLLKEKQHEKRYATRLR